MIQYYSIQLTLIDTKNVSFKYILQLKKVNSDKNKNKKYLLKIPIFFQICFRGFLTNFHVFELTLHELYQIEFF